VGGGGIIDHRVLRWVLVTAPEGKKPYIGRDAGAEGKEGWEKRGEERRLGRRKVVHVGKHGATKKK